MHFTILNSERIATAHTTRNNPKLALTFWVAIRTAAQIAPGLRERLKAEHHFVCRKEQNTPNHATAKFAQQTAR